MFTADYFISKLDLEPHIEGGYFRELYKSSYKIRNNVLPIGFDGDRGLSSTIYFLLKSSQVSKFHKLGFDEIWFYHYGSPIIIHMIDKNGELKSVKLGLNIDNEEIPQVLIPANVVFGAEVLDSGSFSLVSCMVSPGFDYRDFELYKSNELIEKYPEHEDIINRLNGV